MVDFVIKDKLEWHGDFYPWVGVQIEDFSKAIHSIDIHVEELERIEVRFGRANIEGSELPIVEIELSDEGRNKKVTVSFWNDTTVKLLKAFQRFFRELEREEVEEKATA